MKKYVDYTQEKTSRERMFNEQCYQENSPKKELLSGLINQLIATERSRSGLARDSLRTARVTVNHYHSLCRLALINGGRVELEFDEQSNLATLSYLGKELILDTDFSQEPKMFSEIFADCDTINISADGEFFKILMSFDLTTPGNP